MNLIPQTLFKLKNLGVKAKWEEAVAAIKGDSRFDFFSCLSTGEKKQAFAEYQNLLQKQQRDRDRVRKIEVQCIISVGPNLSPFLANSSIRVAKCF